MQPSVPTARLMRAKQEQAACAHDFAFRPAEPQRNVGS